MKRTAILILSALALLPSPLAAAEPNNVVTPEETNEILANPGMGWETFGRPAKLDKSLPDWIPSTVCYDRWGWAAVEPQPGKLNTEVLDYALRQAHDSGQRLAFRISCCSTHAGQPTHPAWLREVGGRELQARYNRNPPVSIPDFDDPIVLERHLDFIRRLGKQYDGHPDLDHVDLGSIGWFGEWHLTSNGHSLLPSMESRMKVVRAYLDAFKRTPLLMLVNGGECLAYATHHGAGWRADCLGDLGGFSRGWCHMRQGYPSWLQQAHCLDAWKTAPVAWESCWDMRKWVNEGWPLRYIFNYALALHASYLNNKSAPLPEGPEVRPEIERFLRRLGYRLVLKELKYPATVKAGGRFQLSSKWQNTGSAPCYRPYRLAYRLSSAPGTVPVFAGTVPIFVSAQMGLSPLPLAFSARGTVPIFASAQMGLSPLPLAFSARGTVPIFASEQMGLSPLPPAAKMGLSPSGYTRILIGKTTVNHWLPGSLDLFTPEFFRNPPDLPPGEVNTAADTLSLPADMPAGQYTVSLAIVDQSEKPVVRLAIKGRGEDGWYPLGKLTVSK